MTVTKEIEYSKEKKKEKKRNAWLTCSDALFTIFKSLLSSETYLNIITWQGASEQLKF